MRIIKSNFKVIRTDVIIKERMIMEINMDIKKIAVLYSQNKSRDISSGQMKVSRARQEMKTATTASHEAK